MPIFLDTHAWVWWVTRDRRLSRRAHEAIQSCIGSEGVWISAISIWELAKRVQKGQLVLDRPLRDWLAAALAAEGLLVAELTLTVLIESCELPLPFHGDPADQIIVATVRQSGARLVTKDQKIRDYPHVQSVW